MKIALVNNLYYPYNRGGAETVIKNMVADLKSQGHALFLITTCPRIMKQGIMKQAPVGNLQPNKIELDGLKIYQLPSYYFNLNSWSLTQRFFWHIFHFFSLSQTSTLKKIITSEKPDLVITHNLMGLGWRLPQILKKLHIRHEHYLHDIQLLYPSGLMMLGEEKIIDSFGAKVYQFFTRFFLGSPAIVTSPSLWLLEQHRQRGFFKGSDTEIKNLITTVTAEIKKRTTKANNFLFVGQIEDHKGILFLLAAWQEASQINSQLSLTVVGDGQLLNEAKKIAGTNKQIIFTGRLDSVQIQKLMNESDYLIIPSLCYENAPMTIYEAHSAGLPVLAASIGGIPEIVNKNDKLFKAGDIHDLKNHLLDIN